MDLQSGSGDGVSCSLTEGEADGVVRSVVGKTRVGCGFIALKISSDTFKPKMPVQLLQQLIEVLSQAKVRRR